MILFERLFSNFDICWELADTIKNITRYYYKFKWIINDGWLTCFLTF